MRNITIILLLVFATAICAEFTNQSQDIQQVEISNEVVFAIKTPQGFAKADISSLNSSLPKALRPFDSQNTKPLFTITDKNGERITLVVHQLQNSISVKSAIENLKTNSQIAWASANYSYLGDPREDSNDPKISEQYHHAVMSNPQAWKTNSGKANIVVAVTDDGVDIDHEDLQQCVWKNTKEIANNGIDDDNNGFIDDVTGWDFSSNDNNPRPNGSASHGTHVAGIVAATLNNGKGVSGTAPGVSVMPLRFYGSSAWTSTVVAKSYTYAVDNGANIITTSFNIDRFVNDKIYRSAIQYVYQNNVLLFNSGGNGRRPNPPRQAFHEVLLVASTIADKQSDDAKSSYSNWGTGMDIAAPGGGGSAGILSTVPRNGYSRKSGTSMAAPNAAAVAALIWSKNPGWTREQVVAQLYASADNVDAVNPSYAKLLGAGRVNSYKAVNSQIAAPKIGSIRELKNGNKISNITKLTIALPNILNRQAVENVANWELLNIDNSRNITLQLDAPYLLASNQVVFTFGQLQPGKYRFRAMTDKIADPFGQKLGEDFSVDFIVER